MTSQSDRPLLIDTHAHLDLKPLARDPGAVVDRAVEAGVALIVNVGIDLEHARATLDLAQRFERIHAVVGFHPHVAQNVADDDLGKMKSLAGHPKVVGYGEIGLDFFRDRSPRDRQRSVFKDQLFLARKLEKPVVIHLRDAYEEGLETIERAAPYSTGGVIHCFSGTRADAQRALDLGFYISIPGTVTYRKNDCLRGIVEGLPLERILLETDCPFLAPEPHRGKTNEPALIVNTAEAVARLQGISAADLARATTANAVRLFGLPDPADRSTG